MYVNPIAFEHALQRMERNFVAMGTFKDIRWYSKLPSRPQVVGKTFDYLVGLQEIHMVKLTHGLKAHEILL
jgi:hypothetical protein